MINPFSEHYYLTNTRGVWQAHCLHCDWKGVPRSEVDPFPTLEWMIEGMEGIVWQHLYQTHHIGDRLFPVKERIKAAWERENAPPARTPRRRR